MRKFRVINAKGDILDLTSDPSKYFFHDISGLGFDSDSEYEQIGYQFVETKRLLKQAEIKGTISVAGYKLYEEMMRLMQSRPLKLEYIANETYYIDVNVKRIEKSELEEAGRLRCPVVFEALGRMYKRIVRNIDGSVGNGKKYDFTFPYRYDDNNSGTILIESDSELESPIVITFMGPCRNPVWTHYVNGNVCCRGKVNCEIPAGDRLVISTLGEYQIIETDGYGSEVQDRYQDSDFTTERFVFLRKGENIISFGHDLDSDLKVVVEGMIYYESI